MNKSVVKDFDYSDYREVHDLFVQEKLTEEDIEDGLEPEEMLVRVCLTKHAYDRMYNTFGRQCEWSEVEDLLLEKGHFIFEKKTGEHIAFVSKDQTLAVTCIVHVRKGEVALIVKTVVRNVVIDNGREVAGKVQVRGNYRV